MEKILKYLIESKADDEFEKTWSKVMSRETFDDIVCLDPTTKIDGDEIINIGFIAKGFLLPKYQAGETNFISDDTYEKLQQQLADYKQNISKYPKIMQFKSIADFMAFMDNPESSGIEITAEKKADDINDIYDKYYDQKLDKKIFDICVAIDPTTVINEKDPSRSKIGDVAKQLLIPKAAAGEADKFSSETFIKNLAKSVKKYYDSADTISKEISDLSRYKNLEEFMKAFSDAIPDSSLVTALKNDERKDQRTNTAVKDSFEIIATTSNYDILRPLTQMAAYAISGGYNTSNGMHWCTGWEPNRGDQYYKYWDNYLHKNGKDNVYIDFIKRGHERGTENRPFNWQIAIAKDGSGQIYDFLDGSDSRKDSPEISFMNFLIGNPDVCDAIKDNHYFKNCKSVIAASEELEILSITEYEITDYKSLLHFMDINGTYERNKTKSSNVSYVLSGRLKKLSIKNITQIPPALCLNMLALTEVEIGEGVQKIGTDAFKGCTSLAKVSLPESLTKIQMHAFSNCINLNGSLRIPNACTEIGLQAFDGTKGLRLKIDQNRTTPIYFNERDKEWVFTHVQGIQVQ